MVVKESVYVYKDQKEEKYAEKTFSCQNFELRIILVDESS